MKIFAIALAIGLPACGGKKEAPPAPAPAPDGVRVINAGEAPLQLLRYHVAKGTTTEVELAIDVDIASEGQGGPLPTLVMTSEMVAEDVLPDGSMTLRTTISDVVARDRQGSTVSSDTMTEQTQLMHGLVLRGTLTPGGTLREMKVDAAGKVLPPGIKAQLDTLSKSFEQVAMPLPATPVGTGAQWMHTRTIDQSGMVLITTTTFTLRAIQGDVLTFDSTTVVTGKDQAITQEGTTIQLSKIAGSGGGKGTVDLSKMMMTGELTAELGSDMTVKDETARMTMKVVTHVQPPTLAAPAGAAPPASGSTAPVPPASGSAAPAPVAPAPATPAPTPATPSPTP